MKAIIIGGGVIGMLSAYYLSKAGIQVSVLEKESEPAQGASAANANQLSYTSYIFPPLSPDFLPNIPKVLLGRDEIVKCKSLDDWRFWLWSLQTLPVLFSRKQYNAISRALWDLNYESKKLMVEFLKDHKISFSFKNAGRLGVYHDPQELEKTYGNFVSHGLGDYVELLGRKGVLEKEPCLENAKTEIAGGLYSAIDEVGNCEAFTKALVSILEKQGVQVEKNVDVLDFVKENNVIRSVRTEKQEYEADLFIVAAGTGSVSLLRSVGIYMPIYPAKGYTYELFPEKIPFHNSITVIKNRMVFTPLDKSLKVSAGLFFQKVKPGTHKDFLNTLKEKAWEIYPEAYFENARLYSGYRPWTPNSFPRVGKTRYKNLYTNTGHGMIGWTIAHATSKRLAGIVKKSV